MVREVSQEFENALTMILLHQSILKKNRTVENDLLKMFSQTKTTYNSKLTDLRCQKHHMYHVSRFQNHFLRYNFFTKSPNIAWCLANISISKPSNHENSFNKEIFYWFKSRRLGIYDSILVFQNDITYESQVNHHSYKRTYDSPITINKFLEPKRG